MALLFGIIIIVLTLVTINASIRQFRFATDPEISLGWMFSHIVFGTFCLLLSIVFFGVFIALVFGA